MSIDVVDTDGAIREAEEAVGGDTRASFFRKAALTGGAAVGGGLLLGGFPELAMAKPSKSQDIKILQYALTLEYLESDFYKEALANLSSSMSSDVLDATKIVSRHENTHVRTLRRTLGRHGIKKPKFDFGDTTSTQAKFLATSVVLEDTGVKAYSGQATRLFQKTVIQVAVSILTVEARHASRFRSLNGQNFAPLPFDYDLSMKTVTDERHAGAFIV